MAYRTFISYFSEDEALRDLVVDGFKGLQHRTWYDERDIDKGIAFQEQIQESIERAHFLVPVLTQAAWKRPWVQQEIGYAIACSVGVLPIVFGTNSRSKGMLGQIPPVVVSEQMSSAELKARLKKKETRKKILAELEAKLGEVIWKSILEEARSRQKGVFRCSTTQEERVTLIEDSARHILGRKYRPRVMQRSALTSFSLPETWADKHWQKLRKSEGPPGLPWFNPNERRQMEKLAKRARWDLIIDPCFAREGYRADVQRAKLLTLLRFLDRVRESKTMRRQGRVVLCVFESAESETIIGDHWMAHSAAVTRFETECETISTWHAPTVTHYSSQFQRNFDCLHADQDAMRKGRPCIEYCITVIQHALDRLRGKRNVPARCNNCRFQCGRSNRKART